MNQSLPDGPLFFPPKLRQDVEIHKVQENFYLQTYWKKVNCDTGPALIVYLFNIETLKFDCLGKNSGHFHINPNNALGCDTEMLWFPEVGITAQIDRTIFELRHNLAYYLRRNDDQRIRDLVIDLSKLNASLDKAKECLLSYIEKNSQMQGV